MTIAFDARPAVAAYRMAFGRLRELEGFDHRSIMRAEAAVILKTWAGRTPVATEEKLRTRARLSSLRGLGLTRAENGNTITINAGIKRGEAGNVWFRTQGPFKRSGRTGKPWILMGNVDFDSGRVSPPPSPRHLKSADWAAVVSSINAARAEYPKRLKQVMASQGLARQSVIQIADNLGIDLAQVRGGGTLSAAGIAKARAALASNGRRYANGVGYQGGDNTRCFVELINTLPYNAKIGMDRVLAGVLHGRAMYIERSYEKGAFDSIARVSRAFPELMRVARPNALALAA